MRSDEQVRDNFKSDLERVQRYKVILGRDRLLGFWVGEQLGKLDRDILDYVASVVQSDLEERGDRDNLRKVQADLLVASRKLSEADLRAKLAQLHEQARHEMEVLPRGQGNEVPLQGPVRRSQIADEAV